MLLALGIELLLWRTGETWSLERVITAQERNPHAFFSRDVIDHGTFRYKYLQVLRRHPQILVLGSSRVMQFRAEMFGAQAGDFYNAGGMIHSIEDLNNFLDRLPPDATPSPVANPRANSSISLARFGKRWSAFEPVFDGMLSMA